MTRPFTRRVLSGAALVLITTFGPALTSPASADAAGTLNVVGTSDVFDSNLIQAVIKPGFEAAWLAAHPGQPINLNYISKGTGIAIGIAEAGGASALLVHAAALENQFVDQGFSTEKYGRAVFWGDYVFLGAPSDPAGVKTGDSHHDIVKAFEKVATAGAAGNANFVSRGSNPGTTIQEHAIWALTTGVPTCTVPDVDGGGAAPSTVGGMCPALSTGTPISYPSWYHATGASQAGNITNGNTCNYPPASSSSPDCYVFTDRGTFEYLGSQPGGLANLGLVVSNNNLAPAAQANLLVNSFHLYAVNPAAVPANSDLNTAGAKALLEWVTSPAGQAAVQGYLESNGDEPFRPSASPAITSSPLPAKVKGGDPVTLKGKIANVVPGTPALDGVKVSLKVTTGAGTSTVKKATTDAKGKFTLTFKPERSATYTLATPKIEKIERPDLDPVFGDELSPATLNLGDLTVRAAVALNKVEPKSGKIETLGKVLPGPANADGRLELWAAHPGKSLKLVGSRHLPKGKSAFDETYPLGHGTWRIQLRYTDDSLVTPGASSVAHVTVG